MALIMDLNLRGRLGFICADFEHSSIFSTPQPLRENHYKQLDLSSYTGLIPRYTAELERQ